MSVPETQRGEGKFNVLVKAQELCVYTIQICCNQNIFLPEYQNALTNDIISTAKDIFKLCWTANNVKVECKYDHAKRKELQLKACEECNNLLALMQIAQKLFHLKTKRIRYWGSFTIEVRNLIRSWIDSDRRRYNGM